MSERELLTWQKYAIQKGLPTRRLEIQTAVIAHTIAAVNGNKDLSVSDFMLMDKKEPKKVTAEENVMALGIGMRKLGQGRKKK
jgi:hypothetical protein